MPKSCGVPSFFGRGILMPNTKTFSLCAVESRCGAGVRTSESTNVSIARACCQAMKLSVTKPTKTSSPADRHGCRRIQANGRRHLEMLDCTSDNIHCKFTPYADSRTLEKHAFGR